MQNVKTMHTNTTPKIMKIGLPFSIGKEISLTAKAEHHTVAEVIQEDFRQYRTKKILDRVVNSAAKTVKRKKLTPAAFGGPFAE